MEVEGVAGHLYTMPAWHCVLVLTIIIIEEFVPFSLRKGQEGSMQHLTPAHSDSEAMLNDEVHALLLCPLVLLAEHDLGS